MKIIINKPFNRQVALVSESEDKINSFLAEHKIKKWIIDKTLFVLEAGSPQVTIKHVYRGRGDTIAYFVK